MISIFLITGIQVIKETHLIMLILMSCVNLIKMSIFVSLMTKPPRLSLSAKTQPKDMDNTLQEIVPGLNSLGGSSPHHHQHIIIVILLIISVIMMEVCLSVYVSYDLSSQDGIMLPLLSRHRPPSHFPSPCNENQPLFPDLKVPPSTLPWSSSLLISTLKTQS